MNKLVLRLQFVITALIVLLVLIGIIGITELNSTNNKYLFGLKNEELLQKKSLRLIAHILELRSSEKNFISHQDPQYFIRAKNYIVLAEQEAASLKQISSAPELHALVNLTLNELSAYQTSFTSMVKESEVRGLDENSGLQAVFRTAAHQLDSFMKEHDTDQIDHLVDILVLYEHSIPLYLDNHPEAAANSVGKLKQTLTMLNSAINTSQINADSQELLTDLSNRYAEYLGHWSTSIASAKKDGFARLSKISNNLKDTVHATTIRGGISAYLTIRKHEKDYMLRKEKIYIDKLKEAVELLIVKCKKSQLNEAQRSKIFSLALRYQDNFLHLVQKDAEVSVLLDNLSQNTTQIMTVAEELIGLAQQTARSQTNTISTSAKRAITILWVATIFSALFGLGCAIFMVHSMRRESINMGAD